jgi:hypothetical protein
MDQTHDLRDAWEAAEAAVAGATDPGVVAALEASAEAANEAYIRAAEAEGLERRMRRSLGVTSESRRTTDTRGGTGMPDRGEFRATTDQMLDFLEELVALERTKQQVEIGSPEFLIAAKKAEDLSRLAFRWAQMQLAMAITIQERIAAGKVPSDLRLVTVEPRPLDRVLAYWREAEFRLQIAIPGSPEAEAATRDIERLREEYQSGHALRAGDGEPFVDGGS